MRKSKEKQYAVLGLGIFGSTIAKTLARNGCEVTAIDRSMECVQRLANDVTQCIQGDITDRSILENAGVGDCDIVVVAVGSHLEESILCILHLVEMKIPYIVAKAKNKSYEQILSKVGAHKVVRPEKDMGVSTAKRLLNSSVIQMVPLDDDYAVVEIIAPKNWVNKSLMDLNVRKKYGINVLGIRMEGCKLEVAPSASYKIQESDHIVIVAEEKVMFNLEFLNR